MRPLTFAVIGLNHGHIYGQINGLLALPQAYCAGFFATEADLVGQFAKRYSQVPFRSREELLKDPTIDLIVCASINSDRGPLAAECLRAGKHFFVDKPPVTRLEDVEAIGRALESSGKMMFVYYSEPMENPLDIKAKQLVEAGALGRLVHLMGLGPHLLRPETRPAWMFDPAQYGGILNDIASHQVAWFAWLTGRKIVSWSSRVGHFGDQTPESFQDFGDATLLADNGVTGYVRVDWFTPRKSPIWGDVRAMIVGTEGTLELRRTINIAAKDGADRGPLMMLTTNEGPPVRVDVSDVRVTWAEDLARSIADGRNYLFPHDMLLRVMETTVRVQQSAAVVR